MGAQCFSWIGLIVSVALLCQGVEASFAVESLQLSAANERKLGVLDYVNSVIGALEINLNDRGICRNLQIGSVIFTTSDISSEGGRQKKTATLQARDITANCEFDTDIPIVGTVPFVSEGSSFTLRAEVFSPDFSRVVPNEARLPDDFRCDSSTFDLELSLFGLDIPVFSDIVTATMNSIVLGVVSGFCEEITAGLGKLLLLVGDNPFLEVIGERLESPADIRDILVEEEALILSKLPKNFEFTDPAQFDALVGHFVQQALVSDLGQAVVGPALQGDYLTAFDAILLILGDFGIELDEQILGAIENILTNEIFVAFITDIITGKVTVSDILSIFQLPIPTSTELLNVFPEEILQILDDLGLLGRIKVVMDFFLPQQSNAEVDFGLTVGFLADLLPPNEITAFLLERFGAETSVLEALSVLFEEITVGEVADLLPNGFGDLFVEVFGEDAVAFDVIINAPEKLAEFLTFLFGNFNLGPNDPIPDILVPILEITTSFRPDLEQFEFITGETTMGEFLALFPLSFDTGTFGVLSLEFTKFLLELEFEFTNFDIAKDFASIILPKIQIKQGSSASIEFQLQIVNGDSVDYTDTVTIATEFDFETQEAIVPAANYSAFREFEFISLASGPALLSFAEDFASCGQASVGVGLSSQRTVANFFAEILLALETDPFIEDTLNEVLSLYAPAVPTFLENFVINFFTQNQGNLFIIDDAEDSCERDFEAIVREPPVDPSNPDSPTGDASDSDSGLDLNVILLGAGAFGFLLLLVAGYFVVVGARVQRKSNTAAALLETENALRPKRPKAGAVATAKSVIPVKPPTRPSRPGAKSVAVAKTVLPNKRVSVPGSFQEMSGNSDIDV